MKQICKSDIVNDNFYAETDNYCNSALSSMKKLSSAILIDGLHVFFEQTWSVIREDKELNLPD